jgi:hypothetical protein
MPITLATRSTLEVVHREARLVICGAILAKEVGSKNNPKMGGGFEVSNTVAVLGSKGFMVAHALSILNLEVVKSYVTLYTTASVYVKLGHAVLVLWLRGPPLYANRLVDLYGPFSSSRLNACSRAWQKVSTVYLPWLIITNCSFLAESKNPK